MHMPYGTEVYNADAPPVVARGLVYTQQELDEARAERLPAVLTDEEGRNEIADLYSGLQLTEFGNVNVAEALRVEPEEDHERGWREGEALAEAWLVDHKDCEFPWPFRRDLRHHRASLPGAELVGFTGRENEDARFAFGQVKTSKQRRNPPQVVTKEKDGLIAQMRQLRDDPMIKRTVVDYLAYRAKDGVAWLGKFRTAATRYFNSGLMEIALFGVLVRDVAPVAEDLTGAAIQLCHGCDPSTRIEFYGMYLPVDCIPEGPQHRPRKRGRTSP